MVFLVDHVIPRDANINIHMWPDLQKPSRYAQESKCILLPTLIATLMRHLSTLSSLAEVNWSAFPDGSFTALWSHVWANGANRGHQMDGMGLKLTPCIDRRLFGTGERFWLIVATFAVQLLLLPVVLCGFFHPLPHHPSPTPLLWSFWN